jgi:hypothetical protein
MCRKQTRLTEIGSKVAKTKHSPNHNRRGIVLVAVVVAAIIFAIVGFAVLSLAEQEIVLTRMETDTTKAFYCAESGLGKLSDMLHRPSGSDVGEVIQDTIEQGTYNIAIDTNQVPCYAISTGNSGTAQRKIRVEVSFLAAPFDNAVYAMNISGGNWAFQLRGTGNPVRFGKKETGGKDIINGNIFLDGDVSLYDESSVNPAPAPNIWSLNGDVDATGSISLIGGGAYISGSANPNAEEPDPVDVLSMDYANNNTHNVSQIFQDAGVGSGYLPVGHELRDVFVKNPGDRAGECATTPGVDDFFFEPSTGFIEGDDWTAKTPLHVGEDRIYYIDGDLWVHSRNDTYGFNMDGKATIVVTGNIHISDNLQYADASSMLGLVALGNYDEAGNLISGGNIYFGDPAYGTMYLFSAMMFAANDFRFNTSAVDGSMLEPLSGFIVTGSFSAMNQVSIERDWYTQSSGFPPKNRAARYDSINNQWVDSETGTPLTPTQIGTLRHYRMIVNYDERVRSPATQPPGLPRGKGKIFAGFSNWEEI